MRKCMIEFLRKFENRGIKIARVYSILITKFIHLQFFTLILSDVGARPSTAPGLGVCKWSPEGLYNKSVSLIPNTDEILKLVKKKIN